MPPMQPPPDNSTCIIYFNICKAQTYQCAGTICGRYLNTTDLIVLLGSYRYEPFKEGTNSFYVEYEGEVVTYVTNKGHQTGNVKTRITFICNETAKWNNTIAKIHGGARAPNPKNIDIINNRYHILFHYDEACMKVPKGESPTLTISVGSVILVLSLPLPKTWFYTIVYHRFIPGLVLYFIVGSLYNKMRGHSGIDMIPHRTFWLQLPDLVMDGFSFTMATLTCNHKDQYIADYEQVK